MHNELTNLLPSERRRALRRDYFTRLGVITALLATALILVAAVLLVPTFVFLTASESTEKTNLATIKSALASSDDATLSAHLAALSNSATMLSALSSTHPISALVRVVLAIPRPGITISSIAYTPATSKSRSILIISGAAETRDALHSYQIALQRAAFISSADLPVSAYAKDTSITFTITVTLAP